MGLTLNYFEKLERITMRQYHDFFRVNVCLLCSNYFQGNKFDETK